MRLFHTDAIATIVDRPNRFLLSCTLDDGTPVRAHLPNPGRMWELVYPGTPVILERSDRSDSHSRRNPRSTRWTAVALFRPSSFPPRPFAVDAEEAHGDTLVVPLVAAGANRIAETLILPRIFPDALRIHREVTRGTSRFDFAVETPDETAYVEVKSCTLAAYGVAMFPDAQTLRGTRHVEELAALRDVRRVVLFIIQGPPADRFVPDIHTDPTFSQALRDARDRGVETVAFRVSTDEDGWTTAVDAPVPVDTRPVALVDDAVGSYVVHLRFDTSKTIPIGALGDRTIEPGHYLYVGSAMGTMTSRTKRHQRRRKRLRWHIDYLRAAADWATVYRIHSRRRIECTIATAFAAIYAAPITAFGSSDCSCASHLFFTPTDPRRDRRFVETMLWFRHHVALANDIS